MTTHMTIINWFFSECLAKYSLFPIKLKKRSFYWSGADDVNKLTGSSPSAVFHPVLVHGGGLHNTTAG